MDDYFEKHGFPPLTLENEGLSRMSLPTFPPQVLAARRQLLEATSLLHSLVGGPMEVMPDMPMTQEVRQCLQTAYRFNIAQTVPLDGDISFEKLAEAIGWDEVRTRHIIEISSKHGIFQQDRHLGRVSHTALSRAIIEDNSLRIRIERSLEQATGPQSSHRMQEATPPRSPSSTSATSSTSQTSFQQAFQQTQSNFEYFQRNPERAQQYLRNLTGLASSPSTSTVATSSSAKAEEDSGVC
ncbi:hypothetical protein MMC25_004235 [Agyrium rufum]|nr:hypothetical protein [Agyrium rufum]